MIKAVTKWNQKMSFTGTVAGNSAFLDAKSPLGEGKGMTPKEMVAVGLCGCTAMDVVALMHKYKQPLEGLEIRADVETTEKGQPAVFTKAILTFEANGPVDAQKLVEAVSLSQTKYCGVSAMLVKVFPISYVVRLNGQEVGRGETNFS